MPQDKRLIVTKALLFKLRRESHGDAAEASKCGIYLEFVVPSVILAQFPDFQGDRIFHIPHPVFPKDGSSTCLIVPKAISFDCGKINKRHHYYDAVITAEAICKRGDEDAAERAVRVASSFYHFAVDSRIFSKLPLSIQKIAKQAKSGERSKSGNNEKYPSKVVTPIEGLNEKESLTFRLSQGSTGGTLLASSNGQLLFRVGHGDMTAGDICENAKNFIFIIKKDYPTVWKYIHDFRLTSNKTDSIRFMEANIQK